MSRLTNIFFWLTVQSLTVASLPIYNDALSDNIQQDTKQRVENVNEVNAVAAVQPTNAPATVDQDEDEGYSWDEEDMARFGYDNKVFELKAENYGQVDDEEDEDDSDEDEDDESLERYFSGDLKKQEDGEVTELLVDIEDKLFKDVIQDEDVSSDEKNELESAETVEEVENVSAELEMKIATGGPKMILSSTQEYTLCNDVYEMAADIWLQIFLCVLSTILLIRAIYLFTDLKRPRKAHILKPLPITNDNF